MNLNKLTWIALALNIAALSAFAGEGGKEADGVPYPGPSSEISAARIYAALNVPEINVTADGILGAVTFEKAVGGLVCQRVRGVVLHPVDRFACSLTAEGSETAARDNGAIYDALDVTEKNLVPPHVLGVGIMGKKVGGLSCTRHMVVYPGAQPTFACTLK